MAHFHMQVDNQDGDLQPLADALCELAKRLGMGLSTVVGKDVNLMDITMRAHPKSTREEVLADIASQTPIVRRPP